LKNRFISTIKRYAKDNSIEIKIPQKEINSPTEIKKYFTDVIKFLNEKKEDLRKFHFNILSNLLTSSKGYYAISNHINLNNNKIFKINDFIVNYSEIGIEKIFNQGFTQNESQELKDIYLYYIFQIKDI